MDLGDFGGAVAERIEIPYEATTLPGYFFRSGAAAEPQRTLIFNNGSDGSVVGAWTDGIADALAWGWNAMTFDGPGQNAALVRQGLAFRPDWEKVITPVVEFFSASRDYVLTDELIAQITTPVLITSPDNEQFWPGQSQELFDKLPGRKAIVAFTEAEGADSHCEPTASGIRGERIFDWLGEQIPPDRKTSISPAAAHGGALRSPACADQTWNSQPLAWQSAQVETGTNDSLWGNGDAAGSGGSLAPSQPDCLPPRCGIRSRITIDGS